MIRLCFLAVICSLVWAEEVPNNKQEITQYYTTERYKELFEILKEKGFSEEEIKDIFFDSRVKLCRSFFRKRKEKREPQEGNPYLVLIKQPIDSVSLNQGKEFANRYRKELEEAEDLFNVDKEVIVAILRIETNFGRYKGKFRVFNVFNTQLALSEDLSVRKRAREELVSFLLICKENGWDPLEIWGSYAGCYGKGQFLPSSNLKFGIDGDSDGKIDLFTVEDAIFSIGSYLRYHGYNGLDSSQTKKALWAYNNDSRYVEAVLWYAKKLKKLLKLEKK